MGKPATIPESLRGLKPRDRKIVVEFHVDFNFEAACMRAGITPDKHKEFFYGLKKRLMPHIEAYGAEELASASISTSRIKDELALLAFHNPADFFTKGAGGRLEVKSLEDLGELARCIQKVERVFNVRTQEETLKVWLYNKGEMLEKLGRAAGMFKDVVAFGPSMELHLTINDQPVPHVVNP